MRKRDVIVVGGSAGAIDALRTVMRGLPPDFPASIFAVINSAETAPGNLADAVSKQSALPAVKVTAESPIKKGHLYAPIPGRHLMLHDSRVRAVAGPKENRFRPSIDVLFRTAAVAQRGRVIGILLSGYLDDGVSGLSAIQEAGGTTVVQDPDDAQVSSLPKNALDLLDIDYCVPAARIPGLLLQLVKQRGNKKASEEKIRDMIGQRNEKPSRYTCPDCGGTLFEVAEGKVKRFRCRVGHAFSDHSLLSAQDQRTENTLWAGQRALQERADMLSRLALRYKEKKNLTLARQYAFRAKASAREARKMKELLESFEL